MSTNAKVKAAVTATEQAAELIQNTSRVLLSTSKLLTKNKSYYFLFTIDVISINYTLMICSYLFCKFFFFDIFPPGII